MDKVIMFPKLFDAANKAGPFIWAKFVKIYPKLKTQCPGFRLNDRLKTTGGRVKCDERIVELSPELYYYNLNAFHFQIIPHELAHIVDYDLTGNLGHGPTWKKIMIAYGIPPDRFHSLINPIEVQRKLKRMEF